MEPSDKPGISEPVGWSVSVEFLEFLVENCRNAGLDSTVVVVRGSESEDMIDPSTHDLFIRGAGTDEGTMVLSSGVEQTWFDEFPPIPPGD